MNNNYQYKTTISKIVQKIQKLNLFFAFLKIVNSLLYTWFFTGNSIVPDYRKQNEHHYQILKLIHLPNSANAKICHPQNQIGFVNSVQCRFSEFQSKVIRIRDTIKRA